MEEIEQLEFDVRMLDRRITHAQVERERIKDQLFTARKDQGWLSLMHAEYESAACRTPKYLAFHRTFKREFTKLLKDNFDIAEIEIAKPNHFDASGFFRLTNGNVYYISVGDLRWAKTFMIRKAKDFKDYTGEANNMLNTEDFDAFMSGLKSVVR